MFCIVLRICDRVLYDEIWNIWFLFGEEVIKLSFFCLGLFLILIEKMCILCLCNRVVFFFVCLGLVDFLFVKRIIIFVVLVFLLLNMDNFVCFSILFVCVDFLDVYGI